MRAHSVHNGNDNSWQIVRLVNNLVIMRYVRALLISASDHSCIRNAQVARNWLVTSCAIISCFAIAFISTLHIVCVQPTAPSSNWALTVDKHFAQTSFVHLRYEYVVYCTRTCVLNAPDTRIVNETSSEERFRTFNHRELTVNPPCQHHSPIERFQPGYTKYCFVATFLL